MPWLSGDNIVFLIDNIKMRIHHFWDQIIKHNLLNLKNTTKNKSHALLIYQHSKTKMKLQSMASKDMEENLCQKEEVN